MLNDRSTVMALWCKPKDSADVEVDVLFGQTGTWWATGSFDTPASLPARPLWVTTHEDVKAGWGLREDGYQETGGVLREDFGRYQLQNRHHVDGNGVEHRPLDDVQDLNWDGATAEVRRGTTTWIGHEWVPIAWASMTKETTGRVVRASFDVTTALLEIESTLGDLRVPVVQDDLRLWGQGGAITFAGGTTETASRPHDAGTTGTGDFSVRVMIYFDAAAGSNTVAAVSPRWRMVWRTDSKLDVQIRDASAWVSIVQTTLTLADYFAVVLTWDDSEEDAFAYIDGVAVAGPVTVSGGGASTGSNPTALNDGDAETRIAEFAMWDGVALDADTIFRQWRFPTEEDSVGLTFLVRWTGGLSSTVSGVDRGRDLISSVHFVLSNFIPVTDAWVNRTRSGDLAQAGVRPDMLFGRVLSQALSGVDEDIFVAGVADTTVVTPRVLAHAGAPLYHAQAVTNTVTFNAAERSITSAIDDEHWVVTQDLVVASAGPNDGLTFTIDSVEADLLRDPSTQGGTVTIVEAPTDQTISATLSNTTNQALWTEETLQSAKHLGAALQIGDGAGEIDVTGRVAYTVALHHAGANVSSNGADFAKYLATKMGPEKSTVAFENMTAGTPDWPLGIVAEGSADCLTLMDHHVKSAASDGGTSHGFNYPACFLADGGGDYRLVGFRTPVDTADVEFHPWHITRIISALPSDAGFRRPDHLEIRYRKVHLHFKDPDVIVSAFKHQLYREFTAHEFSSVTIGTGRRKAIIDTGYVNKEDAVAIGKKLLELQATPVRVFLRDPIQEADLAVLRWGNIARVTFPDNPLTASATDMTILEVRRRLLPDGRSLVNFVGWVVR